MPERVSVEDAVKSGNRREALIAIRDYLAHELEGKRCKSCQMSQLRTGDTAALVLRLTKVMEELAAMPENTGEVSGVDAIRNRRNANGAPAAPDKPHSPKSAQRQQGGRHPSGTR